MSILLPPLLITPRMSEMTYVSMVAPLTRQRRDKTGINQSRDFEQGDLNLNLCKDADLKTQFSLIYLDYCLWGSG